MIILKKTNFRKDKEVTNETNLNFFTPIGVRITLYNYIAFVLSIINNTYLKIIKLDKIFLYKAKIILNVFFFVF